MDLFVLNRYKDPKEEENLIGQETKHLEKLKQRIEERKRLNDVNKAPNIITLKEQKSIVEINNEEPSQQVKIIENEDHIVERKRKNESLREKSFPEFKVLGSNEFEKKTKVPRVLPHWLSHSLTVSTDLKNLSSPIEDQDWIHSTLKSTLISEGLTCLFPVQKEVIPYILQEYKLSHILRPHDICVSAPTGSGKTLAFVLPIIQN